MAIEIIKVFTWKLFGLNELNYHCGKVNWKDMLVEFCSKSIFFEGGRYHRFWIGKSYQKNAFPFTQLITQQKEISSIDLVDLNLSLCLKMLNLMELGFFAKVNSLSIFRNIVVSVFINSVLYTNQSLEN